MCLLADLGAQMIGLVAGEDYTVVEFRPIFGQLKYGFHIKLPFVIDGRKWGEYGVSFSLSPGPTLWWSWKNCTYNYDTDRVIKIIKKRLFRFAN
jgi:hypothetical protein